MTGRGMGIVFRWGGGLLQWKEVNFVASILIYSPITFYLDACFYLYLCGCVLVLIIFHTSRCTQFHRTSKNINTSCLYIICSLNCQYTYFWFAWKTRWVCVLISISSTGCLLQKPWWWILLLQNENELLQFPSFHSNVWCWGSAWQDCFLVSFKIWQLYNTEHWHTAVFVHTSFVP